MWQTWAWRPSVAQQPTKTVPGSSGGGEVPGLGKLGKLKLDFFSAFLGYFGDMFRKTWRFLGLEKLVSPRWK